MTADQLLRYREPDDIKTKIGAIRRLQELEESIKGSREAQNRLALDEVFWRVEQGKVFHDVSDQFQYGSGDAQSLAAQAGIHLQTLRDAHAVYRRAGSMRAFRDQCVTWANQGRNVSWGMVRAWGRKGLDDEDPVKRDGQVQRQLASVESRMTRLAEDLGDLAGQLEYMEDEDQRLEVMGVISHAVEQIQELSSAAEAVPRTQMKLVQLPKPETPRDSKYLSWIKTSNCINCGAKPPVDPHHLRSAGMAVKGSDYHAVPLCRACHTQVHDVGYETFWGAYNPFRVALDMVVLYFTKYRGDDED